MQQDQHAYGDALAVVQPGADQVDPRAFQGLQQVPVGAGLVEAEGLHLAGPSVGRQFQPARHGRVLQAVAADAMGGEVLLAVVEEKAMGFQASFLAVDQIDESAGGFADVDGFIEDPTQQVVEAGFRREAGGDLEEAGNGLLHACHGHRQLVDFQHRRAAHGRMVEIEAADGLGLDDQGLQRLDHQA
ncbi:hypothetical protein D3C76_1038150 [compost metagenome]